MDKKKKEGGGEKFDFKNANRSKLLSTSTEIYSNLLVLLGIVNHHQ